MSKETPNASELILLKALWVENRASARELHTAAGEEQGWSYSTTRTVLNRMVEKGFVKRSDFHGLAVFEPADRKVDMLSRLVRGFVSSVLDSDPGALPASTFAGSRLLDEAERKELQALLRAGPENTKHTNKKESEG